MNNVVFVLARPVDPRNIGAAWRAVANYGYRELRVVVGDAFDEDAAAAFASGAAAVSRISLFDSIPAATADCHQVIGTSVRQRDDLNPTIVSSVGLGRAFKAGARVGLVFGTERTGLTRDEIDRCESVVMLPTAPDFPTMNLSHAVACVAYELRRGREEKSNHGSTEAPRSEEKELPADARARNAFYDHVQAVCGEIGFPPGRPPETVVRRLRKILGRSELAPGEYTFIAGFFTEMRRLARLLFLARQ